MKMKFCCNCVFHSGGLSKVKGVEVLVLMARDSVYCHLRGKAMGKAEVCPKHAHITKGLTK